MSGFLIPSISMKSRYLPTLILLRTELLIFYTTRVTLPTISCRSSLDHIIFTYAALHPLRASFQNKKLVRLVCISMKNNARTCYPNPYRFRDSYYGPPKGGPQVPLAFQMADQESKIAENKFQSKFPAV